MQSLVVVENTSLVGCVAGRVAGWVVGLICSKAIPAKQRLKLKLKLSLTHLTFTRRGGPTFLIGIEKVSKCLEGIRILKLAK